jgi:hypothetical protein
MKYILGIQPNLHHFHTDSDRKMTNLSVNDIKLEQYVLIANSYFLVDGEIQGVISPISSFFYIFRLVLRNRILCRLRSVCNNR